MPRHIRPLMPQSLRLRRYQQYKRTPGSGKWKAMGGFLAGLLATAATLWIALGTPTPHQFAQLTNRKTALTVENEGLQRQIDTNKEEVHALLEKRKSLEEQNNILSQKGIQYEKKNKEMLVHMILSKIYFVIEQIKGNFTIPIGVRSLDNMTIHSVFTINHKMEDGFNEKSWQAFMAYVKEQLREYNKQSKGVKYEITVMDQLNLKAVIELAIGESSDWGDAEKEFAQELTGRVNEYIQKHPEEFYPPLHFVFTGVDMKVSEANKERQRVANLYEAVERGEKHFDSKMHATVETLFLHIWPTIEHVPSFQFNKYDDWYVRDARKKG